MSESAFDNWLPKDYLKQYYTTSEIGEDEVVMYRFINDFLKSEGNFPEMLDLGSGPTIHHILPFIPHVNEIYIADYLPSNLAEVKKWLEAHDDAHDWKPYITASVQLEGKTPDENIVATKIEEIRKKVKHLLHVDIFKEQPLETSRTFPLVATFYCAECATDSKDQWRKGVKNLSRTVAPGGWLIMGTLREATHYVSGNHRFPSANINERDLFEALRDAGFDEKSIVIQVHPIAQWEGEGFTSIMTAKAKKLS